MKSRLILPHTGLRGIAALTVLLTHLGHEREITMEISPRFFPPFWLADFSVDLFFILSGFILHWVYFHNELQQIDWMTYLRARCARILPLYYLTLGAYITPIVEALYYQGLFHDDGKPFVQLMGNLFLLSGFGGVTHWDWTLNEPAWSISIEFFAYFFLFPLLVFLFKKYDREKILYIVIVPATLGMLLCYAQINHIIINWNWTRFARGFFGFPLGFLLCMMFKHSEIKSRIAVDAVGLIAIGIIFLALYSLLPQILILCVLPFLVYFTAFDQGYLCHFLNTPVNQWLGERSYSIYLWHIPFMYVYFIPMRDAIDSMIKIPRAYYGLSNIIIVITGVMIISELSYRYFENPIRRIFLQRGIVNA